MISTQAVLRKGGGKSHLLVTTSAEILAAEIREWGSINPLPPLGSSPLEFFLLPLSSKAWEIPSTQ